MEVNQKQLARILGISDRQVRNLKLEAGMFQREDGEKTYCLERCVPEFIEYKVNSETRTSKSKAKEEIQAEHEEIKKQISQLRLRKLKRELHEASDVEFFLSDMLIRFKNRLLNVPEKLAIKLIGETDINEGIIIIKKELMEVLNELSEYNPDAIDKVTAEDFEDDEEEWMQEED